MATEQECAARLDDLEAAIAGVDGVQGVGIQPVAGGHSLVVYVDEVGPSHAQLPRSMPAAAGQGAVPVNIVAIGEIKPYGEET